MLIIIIIIIKKMMKKLLDYKTNVASTLAGLKLAAWNVATRMYKAWCLMCFRTDFKCLQKTYNLKHTLRLYLWIEKIDI